MSKTTDRAKSAVKAGAKSQAVPAVLVGVAGVAILGYLAGNKAESILGGFTDSLGFGGAGGAGGEGARAKTSESSSIIDKVVENLTAGITESVKSATEGTGKAVIRVAGDVTKAVIAVPAAVYEGAGEGLRLEPGTVQTSKTKAAIAGRTEQGQAWSLTKDSTDQLSKYVGTPGNVVSNILTQNASQVLSGKGDTFSEFTAAEKSVALTNPTPTTILDRVTSLVTGDKQASKYVYKEGGNYSPSSSGGTGSAKIVTKPISQVLIGTKADNVMTKSGLANTVAFDVTAPAVTTLTKGTGSTSKSPSSSTPKTSTYKESGQTKYKDTSGKVHVKVK